MSEITPEETIASTMVFEGSLIKLRKDTVRLNGGKTTVREIVEHAGVVAMVATDQEGALLMVRQYRKPIEQVLLEIPAGGIEEGETEMDAATREMQEETGYTPTQMERLITIHPSPGISDEVMHLYRVWGLEGDGRPTEPSDQIEVERVPIAEAAQMVRSGAISDAKTVVGILMLESASKHNEAAGAG